jgi:hypothetical protein
MMDVLIKVSEVGHSGGCRKPSRLGLRLCIEIRACRGEVMLPREVVGQVAFLLGVKSISGNDGF